MKTPCYLSSGCFLGIYSNKIISQVNGCCYVVTVPFLASLS